MDAFRNYQNLMSGIGENVTQEAKNAKQRAIFNAKNRADEIVKTVGEAKVFISGKPIIKKVGQVLKPRIKKAADQFVKQGEEKFGQLFKPGGGTGPPAAPDVNATVTPNSAGPSRLDALRNDVADRETAAQNAKNAQASEDSAVRRGAKDPEPTGSEETIEMDDIGASNAGREIPNQAFDPNAAGAGVEESTTAGGDITTGLEGGFNAGSDPVFSSVMSQTRGGNLQNPFANARQNKFNPRQEDGQSNTTPRSTPAEPETQSTADAPMEGTQAGGDALDQAAQDAKIAAEAAAKAAAKDAAGGEAVGGILDAIPGAEAIGLAIGAIVAGVGAHRAHRAEEEEKSKDQSPMNPTSFSYQAGVGQDN